VVETKPEPRIATIADNQIVHRGLLEKGSGAPLLREMIGIAAERLMQFETEAVCGAAPRERRRRLNQRNGAGLSPPGSQTVRVSYFPISPPSSNPGALPRTRRPLQLSKPTRLSQSDRSRLAHRAR
jgi:hypothetical protein